MDEYIGIVKLFAGNFAPRGWAMCNGQLMSIAQNTALFSILGTTYGGDGQTTFALPNLQGAVAIGQGNSSKGSYVLGEIGGTPNVTLTIAQMPAHTHAATLAFSSANSTTPKPASTSVAATPGYTSGRDYVSTLGYNDATPDIRMTNSVTNAPTGQSTPVSVMQPYLALNYIICLEGLFPPRN